MDPPMRWLDPLIPVTVDHALHVARARAAVAQAPGRPDRLLALGDAFLAARAFDGALVAYKGALYLDPDGFERWAGFAEACCQCRHPREAIAACERGLRVADDGTLHLLQGLALRQLGREGEAVAQLERALALGPRAHQPLKALLRPLAAKGDAASLLAYCDRLAARHHRNPLVIGYRALALSQLGRTRDARALVDLERHVAWKPLDPPPGYASSAAFNRALAEEILADPPTQTPEPMVMINYDVRVGPALGALRSRAREAIEEYLGHFEELGLGSALPPPPPAATMRTGTTVLYADGSNRQHVHPTGYVSTVYYVRIPESVRSATDDRGALSLGPCDQRAPGHVACWGERRIRPREGWIAIFPSHVFHDVIPTRTAEPRVSVPLDMEPVWEGDAPSRCLDAADLVG
jgi:tetratricopeptide (TPR) repeat protein